MTDTTDVELIDMAVKELEDKANVVTDLDPENEEVPYDDEAVEKSYRNSQYYKICKTAYGVGKKLATVYSYYSGAVVVLGVAYYLIY